MVPETTRFVAAALAAFLLHGSLSAPALALQADHEHQAVTVTSPPVISRLKVAYAAPRRVAIDSTGHVLVADKRAGVVFRTAPDGVTSVFANGLDQPVGLTTDADGNAYIATAAKGRTGAGRVYRVNREGERETLVTDLTAPADLVRDDTGFITLALADSVVRIDPDGERTVLCRSDERPRALARGLDGELFVATEKGSVFQLLADGVQRPLARGLESASDLAITSDGRLVIADEAATHLIVVAAGEAAKPYAKVPKGTVAVCFSAEGNMIVANAHYQSVTRVTTRMSIPCPHCKARIPLILKRPTPNQAAF